MRIFVYLSIWCATVTQADILQAYKDYVNQFSTIDHISLDADYTRAMTLVPAKGVYINAVAKGPYQYRYSLGKFRVDCDIIPSNDDSVSLAQIGTYAFDNDIYQVESPITGVQQSYEDQPPAGTDFPANPLIMNIAFLVEGDTSSVLLGLEHFTNCKSCTALLDDASITSDSSGERHILIQPDSPSGSPLIEYRVYLRNFTTATGDTQLPYKQIMYMDGIEQAIIDTMEYTVLPPDNLVLPSKISFTLIENNEATLEFAARVKSYDASVPDEAVFRIETNESLAQIDSQGIYQSSEGRSAKVPETPKDSTHNTVPNKRSSQLVWVWVLTGMAVVLAAVSALIIYRFKK